MPSVNLNVRFHSSFGGNKQDAINALSKALLYIGKHPDSKKELDSFVFSGNSIIIIDSGDSYYDGNKNVYFNPYKAYYLLDNEGNKIGITSAASILIHEIKHANDPDLLSDMHMPDSDNNPLDDIQSNGFGRDNLAEEKARDAANKLRAFHGEPIRIDNRNIGDAFPVSDPTFSVRFDDSNPVYKWIKELLTHDWTDYTWQDIKNYFFLPRENAFYIYDPLTLDLDGNGIETVGLDGHNSVLFDHTRNGIRTATGWVKGTDGLLVLDRNEDGTINHGGELFGDNTLLKNGERAAHGYEALAEFDDNGDGKVDANDALFNRLRVWRDANQDGISQSEELLTLQDAKVQALNLKYQNANRTLGNGNTLAQSGNYLTTDGEEKQMGNLFFANNPMYSRITDEGLAPDETHHELPDLQGMGRGMELRVAI